MGTLNKHQPRTKGEHHHLHRLSTSYQTFPYRHHTTGMPPPPPPPYPLDPRPVFPSSPLAHAQPLNTARGTRARKETCTCPRRASRSSRRRPAQRRRRRRLRVIDPSPTPSPPPSFVFRRLLTLWVDTPGASGTARRSTGRRARPALLGVVPG